MTNDELEDIINNLTSQKKKVTGKRRTDVVSEILKWKKRQLNLELNKEALKQRKFEAEERRKRKRYLRPYEEDKNGGKS